MIWEWSQETNYFVFCDLIADIIHRRSHISQTSRRRRKALIADHRRYMPRTRLKEGLRRCYTRQFCSWNANLSEEDIAGSCRILNICICCVTCSVIILQTRSVTGGVLFCNFSTMWNTGTLQVARKIASCNSALGLLYNNSLKMCILIG